MATQRDPFTDKLLTIIATHGAKCDEAATINPRTLRATCADPEEGLMDYHALLSPETRARLERWIEAQR